MGKSKENEINENVYRPLVTPFSILGVIALTYFLLNVAVADDFDLTSTGGRTNFLRRYFDWRFWPQWYGTALWLAVAAQAAFLLVRSRAFQHFVGKLQRRVSLARQSEEKSQKTLEQSKNFSVCNIFSILRLTVRQVNLKNVELLTLWFSAIVGVGLVVLSSELLAASRRRFAESVFAAKVYFYKKIYVDICIGPLSQYFYDGIFSWKILILPTIGVVLLFVCLWFLLRKKR